MSQDRKFVSVFMMVLTALIVVSMGIFALSSQIAGREFGEVEAGSGPRQERLLARIVPVGAVRLTGDPAPLAEQDPTAISQAPREPLSGQQVYDQACNVCHGPGIAGSPVFGDVGQWAPRIATGLETLQIHAIEGYTGEAGYMPPKGGRTDLSDQEIYDAIDYIIAGSQ